MENSILPKHLSLCYHSDTNLGWDGMYLEAKRMLEDLEDLLEDSAWTVIDNVHQEVYA